MRGGERRGVSVPERYDCDAGGEVEVAAAVHICEPDALAFDERRLRGRIRRQERIGK
jgi:hypothetical protein